MQRQEKTENPKGVLFLLIAIINGIILSTAYTVGSNWYWGLVISIPLLVMAMPKKHSRTNKQKHSH